MTAHAGRRRRFRRGLKAQSISPLIPNIITLTALASGMTGMRFALEGAWQAAAAAILLAGVLDGLDGRIARLIGATSRFGAELDSLSDFVCFGVAPGVVLYLWSMQGAGRLGWAAALIFAVCAALRLARFNTAMNDERPAWSVNFFTGVPSPAGAGLALLPLIASFEVGGGWWSRSGVVAVWLVAVGALMVSRLPTFALKRARVPARWVLPFMLGVGAFVAGMATEPWVTLLLVGLVYLGLLPIASRAARRLRRANAPKEAETEKSVDPSPQP